MKERLVEAISVQCRRLSGERHRLAINGIWARRIWAHGAMLAANKRRIEKLLAPRDIFAIMSYDRESIAAVDLLMVLLCLHVNVLLMRHLRPVTVTRRGPLSRVLVHVHFMRSRLIMMDVMLIKLLEERSTRRMHGGRQVGALPEGHRFD
jgi:hypothetical protein